MYGVPLEAGETSFDRTHLRINLERAEGINCRFKDRQPVGEAYVSTASR